MQITPTQIRQTIGVGSIGLALIGIGLLGAAEVSTTRAGKALRG
jgi:hypothetical protein